MAAARKRPKRGPSKTNARAQTVRERDLKAVEMRKAGCTFDQVARKLGYADKSHAHKAVVKVMREACVETAGELLELEMARLDTMTKGIWLKAKNGDPQAIDRVLKIQERRARFMGMDKLPNKDVVVLNANTSGPVSIQVTGPDGEAFEFPVAVDTSNDAEKK